MDGKEKPKISCIKHKCEENCFEFFFIQKFLCCDAKSNEGGKKWKQSLSATQSSLCKQVVGEKEKIVRVNKFT